MKKTIPLLIFCLSAVLSPLVAQQNMLAYERIINSNDAKIGLNLLPPENKVKVADELTYHWLKSQEIHETQGDYAGQLLNGDFVRFDRSNNLLEKGRFKCGLKDGIWKSWHQNGRLKELVEWEKGVRNGEYKQFNSLGEMILGANYRNGKLHGNMSSFDKGILLKATEYKKGLEFKADEKKEKRPFKNLTTTPFHEKEISAEKEAKTPEKKAKNEKPVKKEKVAKEEKARISIKEKLKKLLPNKKVKEESPPTKTLEEPK